MPETEHRRQLRATLADREATVKALLQMCRGQLPLAPEPLMTEFTDAAKPRLKRYFQR